MQQMSLLDSRHDKDHLSVIWDGGASVKKKSRTKGKKSKKRSQKPGCISWGNRGTSVFRET